jgi:hypothetical protein
VLGFLALGFLALGFLVLGGLPKVPPVRHRLLRAEFTPAG